MNDSYKFEVICKNIIIDYFNSNVEKTDNKKIGIKDVYVVWMCKTLKNSKALLSTTVSDGMYYEITYNGEKNEIYFDAYKKWENRVIPSNKFNDVVNIEE
ncbi:MAG: hypothetical protein IKL65_00235 [Bacilli bacterium]|nr:hypothetical protein [Bacilli bacterium]